MNIAVRLRKVTAVMPNAKASVLEQFNSPLAVRTFPLPTKIEAGAVLVRTQMAGICGTDVHLWKGQLPISLPVILGHETVGRIETIGEGLERDWADQVLNTGDRVTWTSSSSCGRCYYCTEKGQPTRCPERRAYGIGYTCDQPPYLLGGYAEFHYLHPRTNLMKVPQDLPTDNVIGAGCALITAIHGIERLCATESSSCDAAGPGRDKMPVLPSLWRDNVVVQGAGPVGIAALAVAKNAGAGQLIVIGGPKHRLEMARRFGANQTLDIDELREPAARIDAVRQLTRGYGADAVIECVGLPAVVSEGMEMCRDGGRLLVLGHYCNAGTVAFNPHVITRKQLQIYGSWSSEPRHLKTALEFLRGTRGQFPFDAMVTHRFPVERAHDALMAMANWQSAKSVIVPGLSTS